MGQIINGREIATNIKEEIKSYVDKRTKEGKDIPQIASILVGNDGGSIYYMNSQEKVATSLGVLFKRVELPEDTYKEELLNTIDKLN